MKDLENGLSNKGVAAKYGVLRNTLSTLAALLEKKGMNASRKKTPCGNYEKVDLSFFSSYGDEIRFLTLKIETFMNKEQRERLKQSHLADFFQVVNKIARYTSLLYGRFYIELTKNTTSDNNPVIFIVFSQFLENSNSQ